MLNLPIRALCLTPASQWGVVLLGLQFDRIAGLDVLRTDRMSANRPTAILLHGYGADFQDLAGLASYLDQHTTLNWVFPNGSELVAFHPISSRRAWFPFEKDIFDERNTIDYGLTIPPGLDAAADRIQALLKELHLNPKQLILGGFSQGAIVSCHVALQLPASPKILIQLTSNLIGSSLWQRQLKFHKDLRIFQSHGRQDPILSFEKAKQLHEQFKMHCKKVEFLPFDGGHEIPPTVIDHLRIFIQTNI